MNHEVLMVPGLSNSGPQHWQSLWCVEHPSFRRLEQDNWLEPDPQKWVRSLHQAVQKASHPVVLVAHSLGCITVAWWAAQESLAQTQVLGAFLVAPADVDSPSPHTDLLKAFRPVPLGALPFRSLLVASRNDPYASLPRVKTFAQAWNSELVVVGAYGHVNAESGLGSWPQGYALLQNWLQTF